MLDPMVCGKCKEPMVIERTDGMPLCGKCEQEVRREVQQKLATRLGRENRPKMSMRNMRYVPNG